MGNAGYEKMDGKVGCVRIEVEGRWFGLGNGYPKTGFANAKHEKN